MTEDEINDMMSRIKYLENAITHCQTNIFSVPVNHGDRDLIAIISDLATAIDCARSDLKWLKREIVTIATGEEQNERFFY